MDWLDVVLGHLSPEVTPGRWDQCCISPRSNLKKQGGPDFTRTRCKRGADIASADQKPAGESGKGESEMQTAFQVHCLTLQHRRQTAHLAQPPAAVMGEDAPVQQSSRGLSTEKNNCPQLGLWAQK